MPLSSNFCNGSILGKAGVSSHSGKDQDRLSPQSAVPRAEPPQNLASTRSCPAVVVPLEEPAPAENRDGHCNHSSSHQSSDRFLQNFDRSFENADAVLAIAVHRPAVRDNISSRSSTALEVRTNSRTFRRILSRMPLMPCFGQLATDRKKNEGRPGSRRSRSPFRLFSGGGPHLVTGISSQHGHTIHLPGTLRSREGQPPLFGLCLFPEPARPRPSPTSSLSPLDRVARVLPST